MTPTVTSVRGWRRQAGGHAAAAPPLDPPADRLRSYGYAMAARRPARCSTATRTPGCSSCRGPSPRPKPFHDAVIDVRHRVGIDRRPVRAAHAGNAGEVLDRDRHTEQRRQVVCTALDRLLSPQRLGARAIAGDGHVRANGLIPPVDAIQVGVDDLDGRGLPGHAEPPRVRSRQGGVPLSRSALAPFACVALRAPSGERVGKVTGTGVHIRPLMRHRGSPAR